ncbi:hypothetical protein PspLS_07684 [Pyricularia sp. CBS 133598]|nr:hypothetical protein PspLS_07684 [Pyricularia sp. CBS 133598]
MKFGPTLAAFASLALPATVLAVWECHVTVWRDKTPIGTAVLKEGGEPLPIAGYTCRAGAGCVAQCDNMYSPVRVVGSKHCELS